MSAPAEHGLLGLSEQKAARVLEQYGPNELGDREYRGFLRITLGALREPMVLLLLAIGFVYVFLGDLYEAVSLLAFLFLILGITIYQEQKTEKTLGALKRLSSPRADVIRDGIRKRVPGRDLVPGDVVFLSEGDRIPADIELRGGSPLSVDESALTGESYPVDRSAGAQAADAKRVYSGTLMVRGNAWGVVTSTGVHTELGRIGRSLGEGKPAPSPLQREARRAVKILGGIAGLLTVFVILYYGFTRANWLEATLVGLTLAMAILPNELPAVLLIFLAAGAWRISKRQVLTRRIPAVEALGGISVLCVDKTGTLTQNRMSIRYVWANDREFDITQEPGQYLPEELHEVLEFGVLASRTDSSDPMESAIHQMGDARLARTEHLHPDWALGREYPMTDELLAVSYAWRGSDIREYSVGAKGAPEAIMDLCHLTPKESQRVESHVRAMAQRGARVLAVAKTRTRELPEVQHDLDFEFVGLVGFVDPLRSDARSAVEECQGAGIRVVMITGDHPETARSIAREAGIKDWDGVLSGAELDGLSDKELSERLNGIGVFCRMRPLHKLRVVKLLQEGGEVVAMTGDGVNDAPALQKADIGVAMGKRGTDVAREAASIVLLDDSLGSIVAAIRTGRRVFRNLENAFSYLLAVHIPITALSIMPVVCRQPLVLLPVHIAFLHLVIEPACTTVFEADPEGSEVMKSPPRARSFSIVTRKRLILGLAQGLWASVVVLLVYTLFLWRGHPPADSRAVTFTTLIMVNLGLIAASRSSPGVRSSGSSGNKTFRYLVVATIVLLGLVLYVPILRELFQFEFLHPIDLLICVGGGLVSASVPILLQRVKQTRD